jgi:hypothetical protein
LVVAHIVNDGSRRPAGTDEVGVETMYAVNRESEARGKVVALRR